MRVSLHNIATLVEAQQQSQERSIILVDGDHAELLTQAELDIRVKTLAIPVTPPPIPELQLADIWHDVDRPSLNRAGRRALKRKRRK